MSRAAAARLPREGRSHAVAAFSEGFMSHAGGPSPAGGTRIIEVWESKADQQKFSTRT